jgi:hypothetical protein
MGSPIVEPFFILDFIWLAFIKMGFFQHWLDILVNAYEHAQWLDMHKFCIFGFCPTFPIFGVINKV